MLEFTDAMASLHQCSVCLENISASDTDFAEKDGVPFHRQCSVATRDSVYALRWVLVKKVLDYLLVRIEFNICLQFDLSLVSLNLNMFRQQHQQARPSYQYRVKYSTIWWIWQSGLRPRSRFC